MTSLLEKIKSFLLIGTFVSALFMTQIILSDDTYSSSGLDLQQIKKSNAVVIPQSFFVSFGGMSYTKVHNTVLQEKLWGELRPVLVSALKESQRIEEIEQETYIKAFSKKSLMVRMPFALSISDLYSVLTDETIALSMGSLEPLEFLFAEDSNHSLYLYVPENESYYILEMPYPIHDVSGLLDAVKLTQFIEYRQISERYSLSRTVDETYNQNNYELIPYAYDLVVPSFDVYKGYQNLDDEEGLVRSNISKEVFGDQMDFVKQLRDVNGSLILMYGYGEKTLTFTKEGEILFKSKYEPTGSRAFSFREALDLSVFTLERFGELPAGFSLVNYTHSERSGEYIFYFNYKIHDYLLEIDEIEKAPIVIKVRGNQVTDIYLHVKSPSQTPHFPNILRIISIDECLSQNGLEVSMYYFQDKNIYEAELDSPEYYFPIRSEINSIEMRYHISKLGDSEMFIPCWQVQIAGRYYLFNAYNGELIKTFR